MKIKGMKNLIFYFLVYFVCIFNVYGMSSKYITTDVIGTISTTPVSIIKGITPSANFTVTVRVHTDKTAKGQYVDLNNKRENISSHFAVVEEIHTENGGDGRYQIKFKENGDTVEDTAEFTVSGKMIFDWKKIKNSQLILKIGEVYTKHGNGNSEYMGDVLVDLGTLDMISSLKVNVLQNMDLGTIIAGNQSDTGKGMGEPAKIEVEGAAGENVKLIIPNSAEIKNNSGDVISVNLKFRERSEAKGSYQTTVRNIKQTNRDKETGKTEQIIIDGSMKTKKGNMGDYKGTFTVRVEYDY